MKVYVCDGLFTFVFMPFMLDFVIWGCRIRARLYTCTNTVVYCSAAFWGTNLFDIKFANVKPFARPPPILRSHAYTLKVKRTLTISGVTKWLFRGKGVEVACLEFRSPPANIKALASGRVSPLHVWSVGIQSARLGMREFFCQSRNEFLIF